MKAIESLTAERLFAPFLDPVDGTVCLPADARVEHLRSQTAAHRLRFPLALDETATLAEHVDAAAHAPASSRFGPFCDNILGMNWRLPNGRVARIGERVAKTTTGYDWLRYLLHSGRRFGEPVDYVLRLRPDCGFNLDARFEGDDTALLDCVRRLLRSGWMHWWDAVDFVVDWPAACVRVTVHCPQHEAPLFGTQLAHLAASTRTRVTLREEAPAPFDGLPDFTIKTTPDRAIGLARELASRSVRCVALCYNGVVHGYLHAGGDVAGRVRSLVTPHLGALESLGGDWHSRWLPDEPPRAAESRWIETLERALHAT
jgi:hypothetical protein